MIACQGPTYLRQKKILRRHHLNKLNVDKGVEIQSCRIKLEPCPRLLTLRASAEDILQSRNEYTFIVSNGRAIRNTSEFIAFKRAHALSWSYLSRFILSIEVLLNKLASDHVALVSGLRLMSLCQRQEEPDDESLLDCVLNRDDFVNIVLRDRFRQDQNNDMAARILQRAFRRWLLRLKEKRRAERSLSAVRIQSAARGYIHRLHNPMQIYLTDSRTRFREQFKMGQSRLQNLWEDREERANRGDKTSMLLIYLPPSDAHTDNGPPLSVLLQLRDPSITLVYIWRQYLPASGMAGVHAQLAQLVTMGTIPHSALSRLIVQVPEALQYHLAHNLSPELFLWLSPRTLFTLRERVTEVCRMGGLAVVLPGSPSGTSEVTQRIAVWLNVPVLGGDYSVCASITRPLQSRLVFAAAGCRVPLASDVTVRDEGTLLTTLSRLIATHTAVLHWRITIDTALRDDRLVVNVSWNDLLEIGSLREERAHLVARRGPTAWLDRSVQLNVRRKLAPALRTYLRSYRGWSRFVNAVSSFGCLIESVPNNDDETYLGMVEGSCLITPLGTLVYIGGVDCVVSDTRGREETATAILSPQQWTPRNALQGATCAVASHLHSSHGLIGYVNVLFRSQWEASSGLPRLTAHRLYLGASDTTHVASLAGYQTLCSPPSLHSVDALLSGEGVEMTSKRTILYLPHLPLPTLSRGGAPLDQLIKMQGLSGSNGYVFLASNSISPPSCLCSARRSHVMALAVRAAEAMLSLGHSPNPAGLALVKSLRRMVRREEVTAELTPWIE